MQVNLDEMLRSEIEIETRSYESDHSRMVTEIENHSMRDYDRSMTYIRGKPTFFCKHCSFRRLLHRPSNQRSLYPRLSTLCTDPCEVCKHAWQYSFVLEALLKLTVGFLDPCEDWELAWSSSLVLMGDLLLLIVSYQDHHRKTSEMDQALT